jgi:MFS family permease
LLLGKISDRVGRYPVFLCGSLLELVTPLFFALGNVGIMKVSSQVTRRCLWSMGLCLTDCLWLQGNRVLVFALACALGLGASGANIMIKTMVGDIFNGEETASALACSK